MNTLPADIFKAYDIRGVVEDSLTPQVVERIGQALGSEARERGQQAIIIGRDGRLSGPALSRALAQGIRTTGCNVIDVGSVPTPLVYFAGHCLATQSAVCVTGSHNPPAYNGLKMVVAGETLSGDRIQALRQRILEGRVHTGEPGAYARRDIAEAYLNRVTGDVALKRPMNIVVDCGNGVAGAVAPALYRALGCTVTELYCAVDGTFPNHHPDPSQPDNLTDLIRVVGDCGADLGLAFDGDGDRLGVVSADGTVIWPDRQMILFARDILARNPGAQIIFDVKCSRTLPAAITAAGGTPLMCRTGHSFIKAKLKETGAALAGEMSGHIFFKERWYGFDDGLYAGARLLELLARDPRPAAHVFAGLPDSVNTPELHIEMDGGNHFELMDELVHRADFPGASVSHIDGLRVDYEDGFGLVRPSNTTPILVLRFEADNRAALERIQDQFRRLITDTRPHLRVPF